MKMGSGKWKVVVLVCISIALHFPLSSFHSAQGQVRVNPGSFDNGIRNTNRSSGSNRNNASTSTTNQFPNDSTQSQADTSATKGLIYHKEIPDSVLKQKVYLFHYRPTLQPTVSSRMPSANRRTREYARSIRRMSLHTILPQCTAGT